MGERFFKEFSKIPPASLEWRPFWATADLSGASRAHGMPGKILWSEIAGRMHLRMATLMALTGAAAETASRAAPAQQKRFQTLPGSST